MLSWSFADERECVTSTRLREEWNFLKTLSLGYGHLLNEKKKNKVTWDRNDVLVNHQDYFDEKEDHAQTIKTADGTRDDKLKHGSCGISCSRTLSQVGAQPGAGILTRSNTSCCHPQEVTIKASVVPPENLLHIQNENKDNRHALEKRLQIYDDNEFKSLKRPSTTFIPVKKEPTRVQRRVSSKIKLSQENKSHAQRSSSLPSNQYMNKDDIDDVGASACAAYKKKMEYFNEWYRERDYHQQMQKWIRHIKEVQTTPRFREAFAYIKKVEDPFRRSQRIQMLYDKCRRSFAQTNPQHAVSLPRTNTNLNELNRKKESKVYENKMNNLNERTEEKNRLRSNRFSYDSIRNRSPNLNKAKNGSRNYDTQIKYKGGLNSNIEKHTSKNSYSSYGTNEEFRDNSLAAAAIFPEAPITHGEGCQDESDLCQDEKCFHIHGNLTGDILWDNAQNYQNYSCCPQHSNVAYNQPIMCPVHSTVPMYANTLPTVNPMVFPDFSVQHHSCSPDLSPYALHSITPVACPVHQCISPSSYNTFGSFGIAVPLIKTCPTSMYEEQQQVPNLCVTPGSASSVFSPTNDNESIQDEKQFPSTSNGRPMDKVTQKLNKKSGITGIKKFSEENSLTIKKSLLKKTASAPIIRKLSSSTSTKEGLRKLPIKSTHLTLWKKASPRKLGTAKLLTNSKKSTIRINSINGSKKSQRNTDSLQKASDRVKIKDNISLNIHVKKDGRQNVVPKIKNFQTRIPKTPLSSSRKVSTYNSSKSQHMLHSSSSLSQQHRKSVLEKTSVSKQCTNHSPSFEQKTIQVEKKNSGAQPIIIQEKTGVTNENALQLVHQQGRAIMNEPDQFSNSEEITLRTNKDKEMVPRKDSKVISSIGNKIFYSEPNDSTSDNYSKIVSEEDNVVITGNNNKIIYHDETESVSTSQAKGLPVGNKQTSSCEGSVLVSYKGNKRIMTKNKTVTSGEEKNEASVKEDASVSIKNRVLTPREERDVNSVKENTSISTENTLISTENTSISTENASATSCEDGEVVYTKRKTSVNTENKMATPCEEGEVVYAKRKTSVNTEDKMATPYEEGEVVYVKGKTSVVSEDKIVPPCEEGDVIYVKGKTLVDTENKIATPREEGDVIYVKTKTFVDIEDKMVTPYEQRQAIYVKENLLNPGLDKDCIVIKETNYNEANNDVHNFLVQENESSNKKKDTFFVQRSCNNYSTDTGKLGVFVSQRTYKETGNRVLEDSLTRNVAVVEPILLKKKPFNYKIMNFSQGNQGETTTEVSNISIFSVKKTSSYIAELPKTTDPRDIFTPCNVGNTERMGFQFEDFGERTAENKVSCNLKLTKTCENNNALYSKNYETKSSCVEKVSMDDDMNRCFWTRQESCEPGKASEEKFTITPRKDTRTIPAKATVSNSLHDSSKKISDFQNKSENLETPSDNPTGQVKFEQTPLANNNSITYCKYHNIESEMKDARPSVKLNENLTPRVVTGTGLTQTKAKGSPELIKAKEFSLTHCQTPPCFVFHKCNLDPYGDEKQKIYTEKSVFRCQPQKDNKSTDTQRFIADTLCENEQLLKDRETLGTTPLPKISPRQPYESYVISDKPLTPSTRENNLFLKKNPTGHPQHMKNEGILKKTPFVNCTKQKKLDGFFRPLIHENSPIFTLTSRRSHVSATSRN